MERLKYLLLLALAVAVPSGASVITFVTPTGSTTSGGPVNASAQFTTGAGTVQIILTNLQANPTDVAQLISDIDFVLSTGQTTGTIASSSGTFINVAANGTTSSGGSGTLTGWAETGLHLSALGGGQPTQLIIGPPGPGGVYTNANGSIAGNGPHNPFTDQTATFLLNVNGVTAASTVSSAIFSFGTTAGITVPGIPQQTTKIPEPASLALLGIGLLAFGASRRKKA